MGNQKEKAADTYTLRITDNAYQNIDDIAEYLAYIQQQPLNAIKVVDAILLHLKRLKIILTNIKNVLS